MQNIAGGDTVHSSMHPLKSYIVSHSLTAQQFADLVAARGVNTTGGYISQILIGHRRPATDLAIAISDATRGEVTVDALLRFERRPRRRKRRAA